MTSIGDLVDKRDRRNLHWTRLRRAWTECPSDYMQRYQWLETQWGLRVYMADGMITDDYTVVDEKKYLMYLLKFG